MSPGDPLFEWLRAAAYIALATIGGAMGHLMRTLDQRQRIRWGHTALEGVAAGFVGLLVLFMCQATGLSEAWTGVIVGVCGWLGASASIRLLERIVWRKLGVGEPPEPLRERADD